MSKLSRRLVAAVFLLGLIALGIFGARWQPSINEIMRPHPPGIGTAPMRLYFADENAECLLAESQTITAPGVGSTFVETALAALTALADGPASPDLWAVIPPEALVLDLTLQDGIAIVNYTEELRTNHGGGSAGEMLTVAAIAGTLAEFPEVRAVHILLEGKVAETLVGHLSLLEPIQIAANALALGRICWDGIQ